MEQRNSIKYWAEDDRPREKMILKGRSALSDAELLAILIGSGTRTQSAVEICKQLLATCNNDLHQFARLTLKDLCAFKGIGPAKAVTLLAAMELGRRRRTTERTEVYRITSPASVYEFVRPLLSDLHHEEFYILLLNRQNEVLKPVRISQGGYSSTLVDIKMILSVALEHRASSIILVHNHPSNTLRASEQDIRLTRKIVEAAQLMEIQVLDHLIVTDSHFLSLADDGLM